MPANVKARLTATVDFPTPPYSKCKAIVSAKDNVIVKLLKGLKTIISMIAVEDNNRLNTQVRCSNQLLQVISTLRVQVSHIQILVQKSYIALIRKKQVHGQGPITKISTLNKIKELIQNVYPCRYVYSYKIK